MPDDTPYRELAPLPVWTGRAICVKCEHYKEDKRGITEKPPLCGASPGKHTNYVTGEISLVYPRCEEQNPYGYCKDFSPVGYRLPEKPEPQGFFKRLWAWFEAP